MKKKLRKRLGIFSLISISAIILLFALNYKKINRIYLNKKAEQSNSGITFQIYSNENDILKILVTAKDEQNGIKKLIYLNEDGKQNEIDCYGKTQVAIDYEIKQNGEYEFTTVNNKDEENKEKLIVDDNYRNNLIPISVTTEKNLDINGNVTINFPENNKATKMYKIGENGTWTEYQGEFTINSYDIIEKNLQNGNTRKVDIYAKMQDEAKNVVQIKKEIENIDVDIPETPDIVYNGSDEKVLITADEIGLENPIAVSIKYEERNDVDNYYSLDKGESWNLYNGEFQTRKTIVMAKSVKKNSSLESDSTQNCNSVLEKGVTKVEAYDNDVNTYQFLPTNETNQCTLYTSNEVIGKNIHFIINMTGKYTSIRAPGYIVFYNGSMEIQKIEVPNPGSFYGGWTKFDKEITIPEKTEKIVLSAPNGDLSHMYIYEIQLSTE